MSSWKKRLRDEFDAAAPKLRSDIAAAPIITSQAQASNVNNGGAIAKRKIGLFGACGAVAVVVAVMALLAIFGVFDPKPIAKKHVFALEINPAVAFVTDGDGTVQSVNALNADADVILANKSVADRLKNVPLAEAVVIYTDSAARLGYLDLTSADNIVRFTGSSDADKALMSNASDDLRGYFKTNGIYAAVSENVTTAAELGARLGVPDASSVSELADKLAAKPTLFGERIDAGASDEALRELYDAYIVGTQMLEFVRAELLESVNDIAESARMLSQMVMCNYNIMMHRDNPFSPIPADYWALEKYGDGAYTDEFSGLLDRMRGLLTEYENKFGKPIGSSTELVIASDAYSSMSDDFEALFTALSPESFAASASKYVEMLKNIGRDESELDALLSAPHTVEEYFAQLQTATARLYASRTDRYKPVYEAPRSEISDGDYADFVDGLIAEYGSLENYWNEKNSNKFAESAIKKLCGAFNG